MINTTFFKKLAVVLLAVFFASCDKDYNTLGLDVVGNENFLLDKYDGPLTVKAFNQKVDAVQSNNLPINQLGLYGNPVFGATKGNFVTQLTLKSEAPVFGANVVIDSVILSVPYFSHVDKVEASGHSTYILDSIYDNNVLESQYTPIDLRIYENGYYLNDFDPDEDLITAQKYYSNQDADFNSVKIPTVLNDSTDIAENSSFVPNPKEYVKFKVESEKVNVTPTFYKRRYFKTTTVEKRSAPVMRLRMKKSVFQSKIINALPSDLANNNRFKNYFKGLYFQVQDATAGTLMSLDFTKGDVTIYYKEDLLVYDANNVLIGNERPMKNVVLSMASGNKVNLLENTDSALYSNAITNASTDDATHPSLYVKGGRGSQVFIDLFTEAELSDLRDKNLLINQANIIFTIDQTLMAGAIEPQRVYLFDAKNNVPLTDYGFDNTTNTANTKLNKYMHGGIIKRDKTTTEKRGIEYKINITEHVNNIIKKKAENVRLALVVTENINTIGNYFLKTPVTTPNSFDRVPVSSIINPLGTVLYGSNPGVGNEAKKIKFEIYYTKPN